MMPMGDFAHRVKPIHIYIYISVSTYLCVQWRLVAYEHCHPGLNITSQLPSRAHPVSVSCASPPRPVPPSATPTDCSTCLSVGLMLLQVISFSLVLGAHEYVGKILSRYTVKSIRVFGGLFALATVFFSFYHFSSPPFCFSPSLPLAYERKYVSLAPKEARMV